MESVLICLRLNQFGFQQIVSIYASDYNSNYDSIVYENQPKVCEHNLYWENLANIIVLPTLNYHFVVRNAIVLFFLCDS